MFPSTSPFAAPWPGPSIEPFPEPWAPSFDPAPTANSTCDADDGSPVNVVLGIGANVGTFICFVPQFVALWRAKSVNGVSLASMFLGIASTAFVFVNYLYINWVKKSLCCEEDGPTMCMAHTMDGQQLAITMICSFTSYILWMWYYDHGKRIPEEEVDTFAVQMQRKRTKFLTRTGLVIGFLLLILNVVLAGLLNTVAEAADVAYWVGFSMGIAGAICVVVQWGPQIWLTWKLQEVGSLSIVMLCLQLPGDLVLVYVLAVVQKTNWTTILAYAVTAVEFAILLAMCIWFTVRDRVRRQFCMPLPTEDPDEEIDIESGSDPHSKNHMDKTSSQSSMRGDSSEDRASRVSTPCVTQVAPCVDSSEDSATSSTLVSDTAQLTDATKPSKLVQESSDDDLSESGANYDPSDNNISDSEQSYDDQELGDDEPTDDTTLRERQDEYTKLDSQPDRSTNSSTPSIDPRTTSTPTLPSTDESGTETSQQL